MRPYVVLSPVRPLNAAGLRTDPPVSEPMAAGANPAATATPEPLLEPPGTRCAPCQSHGLRGVPMCALVPDPPNANSAMCVFPRIAIPDDRRHSITVLVRVL